MAKKNETENFAEDQIKQLLGKTEDEAYTMCKRKGLRCRTIQRDGKTLPGTEDINPYRMNFKVEKNIVVEVTTG